MMRRALILAALVWCANAAPASALGCIALLGCSCTISASELDFDEFSPLPGGVQTAIGEINVDCANLLSIGAGVVVRLNEGQWGNFSARKMRSGSGAFVNYNIYTTNLHNTVLGSGAGGSVPLVIDGGLIVLGHWSAQRDMFGRLQAAPNAIPGAYSDTVTIRVEW